VRKRVQHAVKIYEESEARLGLGVKRAQRERAA
jgi:hypothetical protein